MFLCLRIDLDYVPWDSPDAAEFGHGEPAVVLRLLEAARLRGLKFHFFASTRTIQTFPSVADAVLGDGHDLDWLCKHPEQASTRFAKALRQFVACRHVPLGIAVKESWPESVTDFDGLQSLKFLSSAHGSCPANLIHFPVETRGMRDALRSGVSYRAWSEQVRQHLADAAASGRSTTVVLRPQVVARHDPKLTQILDLVEIAEKQQLPLKTLRDGLLDR